MTASGGANIAQDDAQVGVQAQTIHGDVNYHVSPDDTPEERFRIGVRYLEARMPAEARRLIEEAVARGYDSDEVQFHRLLALLSGRTLRQLGSEDFDHLSSICERIPHLEGDGEWTAGLRVILRLLDSLGSNAPDAITTEIDRLGARQRDKILSHLEVLLEGPAADLVWRRSVERAKAEQLAGDRANRLWMFFHPRPAPPRVRPVAAASTSVADWLRASIGATAFLLAVGLIGWPLLQRGELLPIVAHLAAVVGVVAFVVEGADWYFRHERIRAKDAELLPPPTRRQAPAGGFARKLDRLFHSYFARYVPEHTDRAYWLAQTAGIRRRLRDELVEIYREQRVEADQVAWLVRFLVAEVKQRWRSNTLTAYRAALRPSLTTRALCAAGLALAVVGGGWAGFAAVRTAPWQGVTGLLLAVAGASIGTRAWFTIAAERWRVAADRMERTAQWAARCEAFRRWQAKLSGKPSDAEIATWLECDRKLLVDDAVRHYRLRPSQVIAHAFIEAPAGPYKRARVRRGPWRYSRYRLLLFLLTEDGVRQVHVELDFENATSRCTQRLNYRFDAVAAVRIDGVETQQQTLELSLVNGEPIRVRVTEASTEQIQPGEDPWALSRIAVDASGLVHTLNILEGIAAEGKEWIRHQRQRADERLAELTTTIRKLID